MKYQFYQFQICWYFYFKRCFCFWLFLLLYTMTLSKYEEWFEVSDIFKKLKPNDTDFFCMVYIIHSNTEFISSEIDIFQRMFTRKWRLFQSSCIAELRMLVFIENYYQIIHTFQSSYVPILIFS